MKQPSSLLPWCNVQTPLIPAVGFALKTPTTSNNNIDNNKVNTMCLNLCSLFLL